MNANNEQHQSTVSSQQPRASNQEQKEEQQDTHNFNHEYRSRAGIWCNNHNHENTTTFLLFQQEQTDKNKGINQRLLDSQKLVSSARGWDLITAMIEEPLVFPWSWIYLHIHTVLAVRDTQQASTMFHYPVRCIYDVRLHWLLNVSYHYIVNYHLLACKMKRSDQNCLIPWIAKILISEASRGYPTNDLVRWLLWISNQKPNVNQSNKNWYLNPMGCDASRELVILIELVEIKVIYKKYQRSSHNLSISFSILHPAIPCYSWPLDVPGLPG